MAKIKSPFLEASGKLGNLVFVNNKVHGAYVRVPRGSYKTATINDTLQQNADKAKKVTGVARSVYQALSSACGSFRQRNLWQMILKRMYKASSAEPPELIKSLEGMEMNAAYAFEAKMTQMTVEVACENGILYLTNVQKQAPVFAPSVHVDCYCYCAHILWLDSACAVLAEDKETTQWMDGRKESASLSFCFDLPAEAAYYLVLLEINGGEKGRKIELRKAEGMRVVAAGILG